MGGSQRAVVGWPLFHRFLLDLFDFMEPFLRSAELSPPIRLLYQGSLRVLLVLLHDFPEFLVGYHFSLCDVIPPTCIQMRNLILSAFPRNMRLPDPFTPNLKVDMLPEIKQSPHMLSDHTSALARNGLKDGIDSYLLTRSPSFLPELTRKLAIAPDGSGGYNIRAINALVFYVGVQAISQNSGAHTSPVSSSAPMDIFLQLTKDLDKEGRYHFLTAIANQLRYPNNHTHYFSCVLLFIFGLHEVDIKQSTALGEIVKEQITRVLLERLIVNRPHPWGLLITFIELIKNPRYNFWAHKFVRCAPEIEKLFESVARSCTSSRPPAVGNPDDQRAGAHASGGR
eukprot:COSAG01_NODE_5280_length_4359_cov_2.299296_1_plen_340_part_00